LRGRKNYASIAKVSCSGENGKMKKTGTTRRRRVCWHLSVAVIVWDRERKHILVGTPRDTTEHLSLLTRCFDERFEVETVVVQSVVKENLKYLPPRSKIEILTFRRLKNDACACTAIKNVHDWRVYQVTLPKKVSQRAGSNGKFQWKTPEEIMRLMNPRRKRKLHPMWRELLDGAVKMCER